MQTLLMKKYPVFNVSRTEQMNIYGDWMTYNLDFLETHQMKNW